MEIHLVEDGPGERIEAWLLPLVKRIIVHYEVTHDLDFITRECRKDKIHVGLSVASHTSWTHLKPFAEKVDLLQILAVHTGPAGQDFERHNISKIKHLRSFCREHKLGCKIEVDGGVTPEIAEECSKAGADVVVSANYIFNHPSPKMAIKELRGEQ